MAGNAEISQSNNNNNHKGVVALGLGLGLGHDLKGTWRSVESFDTASVTTSSSQADLCPKRSSYSWEKKAEAEAEPSDSDSAQGRGWRKYAGLLLTLSASLLFSLGVRT
jgi:hypothetical protein